MIKRGTCSALGNNIVTNIRSFLCILTTLKAQLRFLTIMPALIYASHISHLLDLSGNPLLGSCMFLKHVKPL